MPWSGCQSALPRTRAPQLPTPPTLPSKQAGTLKVSKARTRCGNACCSPTTQCGSPCCLPSLLRPYLGSPPPPPPAASMKEEKRRGVVPTMPCPSPPRPPLAWEIHLRLPPLHLLPTTFAVVTGVATGGRRRPAGVLYPNRWGSGHTGGRQWRGSGVDGGRAATRSPFIRAGG